MAHTSDLKGTEFPDLSSGNDSVATALRALRAYSEHQVTTAIDWYYEKRKPKRFWGRVLTMAALFAFGASALVPVVGTLLKSVSGRFQLPDLSATLLVGVAGGLIVIERFFGCTSGWVRYVEVGQRLKALLEDFRFDWELAQLEWATTGPSAAQTAAGVRRCKRLIANLESIVQSETRRWAAEFQRSVSEIQETVRKSDRAVSSASIDLRVAGGDTVDGPWEVFVDGEGYGQYAGTTADLTVASGLHRIEVRAVRAGKPLSAARELTTGAGETVSVDIDFTAPREQARSDARALSGSHEASASRSHSATAGGRS